MKKFVLFLVILAVGIALGIYLQRQPKARTIEDKVQAGAEQAGIGVKDGAQKVADMASDVAATTKEIATNVARKVVDVTTNVVDKVKDTVQGIAH